ncbi:von Willebrand factor A domain-containing protein 7-like [Mytilus californianus]|uniref:von Willebrand factor A domain-containing protein 7-like n=1 Tax=Mytilus californianus TaxID=6549 RepID=UPI0022456305|nr:von Willebrand factor A domain-containing protein 7-like [Mytilus californianus]XP_052084365.1 von Willebrand factor A domain-containing protein 7-like [Mytilus californianus]
MAIFKTLFGIIIMMIYSSDGFPPDALTGSASYTKHHAEITRISIRIAVGKFIKENNLTAVDDSIDVIDLVDAFFGDDKDGLQEFSRRENEIIQHVKNQEISETAYIHCNSEQIELANIHILQLRKQIGQLAQSSGPDLSFIRDLIGKCLYTIQAFYSGTNWVEMNGNTVYRDFGVPNKTLMAVADTTVDTCRDCDNSGSDLNSCKNNLLINDLLTSGYQTGHDIQPPYKTSGDMDKGKCGFGGSSDTENGQRTGTGGINKDRLDPKYSPHHHLHYQAFFAARKATEQFLIDPEIGIINELQNDIFAEVFNLKEKHKASLAFVIDDTGSMGNNIAQVQDACVDIITDVLDSTNEPSDYILVTFNDPDTHIHRLTTTNGLEMIEKLESLIVYGGGDCPEYAMSGLMKGIELCREHSILFFFTDAPAKDESDRQAVIDAANAKHIQLMIFLQEDLCKKRKKRETGRWKRETGSAVYYAIAEATGGKVYQISTSEIADVMKHITQDLLPSATAVINVFNLDTTTDDFVTFPVDNMITNMKVTVLGAASTAEVDVHSPLGSVLTSSSTQVLFESPNKVVVTVASPTPGMYTLSRTGNNHWSVNITAQSANDFDYTITKEAGDGYLYKVLGNPIIGETYTIFLTVYNLPENATVTTILLTEGSGSKNLFNLTQMPSDFDSTYFTTALLISELYQISIHGTDDNGTTWMRTSPYTISPVNVRLTLSSTPDLYINTFQNVSYILENKGTTNETFTATLVDNRGLLTGQTYFEETIASNESSEIIFQLQGSSSFSTVTYTISVTRSGSTNTLQKESKTLYISPDIPPTCSVDTLNGHCDNNYGNGTCLDSTWTGQATITFTTDLLSVTGSNGMNVDTSSLLSSPSVVSVSGTCCTPSTYLTVIDKNNNFVRCHFFLGDVIYIDDSKSVLSTAEQIAVGVIAGIVVACLLATLTFVIVVYRKGVKPKLNAMKVDNLNRKAVKDFPMKKDYSSKQLFYDDFMTLKCDFKSQPPRDTHFPHGLELEISDIQ